MDCVPGITLSSRARVSGPRSTAGSDAQSLFLSALIERHFDIAIVARARLRPQAMQGEMRGLEAGVGLRRALRFARVRLAEARLPAQRQHGFRGVASGTTTRSSRRYRTREGAAVDAHPPFGRRGPFDANAIVGCRLCVLGENVIGVADHHLHIAGIGGLLDRLKGGTHFGGRERALQRDVRRSLIAAGGSYRRHHTERQYRLSDHVSKPPYLMRRNSFAPMPSIELGKRTKK